MAQHYPGLGHGSNSKETFVIFIQKIYQLVPFKIITSCSGIYFLL